MTSTDELRGLLEPAIQRGEGYIWELCAVSPTDAESLQQIAEVLARNIVEHLCPPHVAQLWRDCRNGVRAATPAERERLITYLEPHFGHPTELETPGDSRAAGAVSEFLWFELVRHRSEQRRRVARIEGPGFAVTDPGGDGLVVYRTDAGSLTFRLWEIKKHESEGSVAATVNGARDQLNTRALSYLARYSAVAQQLGDEPELQRFYATLVDLWQARDEAVGVGVAVATSSTGTNGDCFAGMPSRFPHMADGDRLEGLLNAIGDYGTFVRLVKDAVWSGL